MSLENTRRIVDQGAVGLTAWLVNPSGFTIPITGFVGISGVLGISAAVGISGTIAVTGPIGVSITGVLGVSLLNPIGITGPVGVSFITPYAVNAIGSTGFQDVLTLNNIISGTSVATSIPLNGMGSVQLQITGTWTGTFTWEGTAQGSTFFSVLGIPRTVGTAVGSATVNGNWVFPVSGFQSFRVVSGPFTSGTATISMIASQAPSVVYPLNLVAGNLLVQASPSNTANTTPWLMSTKTALTASGPSTIIIGLTTTTIVASNANRKGLLITNVSANTISLAFAGASAILNNGVCLFANGGAFNMNEYSYNTGAVAAISSGNTSQIGIQEFTT